MSNIALDLLAVFEDGIPRLPSAVKREVTWDHALAPLIDFMTVCVARIAYENLNPACGRAPRCVPYFLPA